MSLQISDAEYSLSELDRLPDAPKAQFAAVVNDGKSTVHTVGVLACSRLGRVRTTCTEGIAMNQVLWANGDPIVAHPVVVPPRSSGATAVAVTIPIGMHLGVRVHVVAHGSKGRIDTRRPPELVRGTM